MGISSAAGGQMEAFGAVWIEPSTWIYLITLFYTIPDMGLAYCVSQQITCIFLGIFMAYVYMRTENIWVPVAVHFLNNNLIPMFAGNYTADMLQGQAIHWGDLIPALILNLVIFGWFLFLKPLRKEK